jgi:hypothetical protein
MEQQSRQEPAAALPPEAPHPLKAQPQVVAQQQQERALTSAGFRQPPQYLPA